MTPRIVFAKAPRRGRRKPPLKPFSGPRITRALTPHKIDRQRHFQARWGDKIKEPT